jgi:multidrug resistance efflux pump
MTDPEAAAWTRGHAVGERELKAAEKGWQAERAELKAQIERLRAALVSSLPTVGMGWIERAEKAEAEVERLRANRDFWHQACLQAQEHRDGANASNAVWEAETVKLRAEVEMLRAALKTAKWMLERDYIDDQKMAVIRKCEAALGEPK